MIRTQDDQLMPSLPNTYTYTHWKSKHWVTAATSWRRNWGATRESEAARCVTDLRRDRRTQRYAWPAGPSVTGLPPKLQALVYDMEEGAGKWCSECGSDRDRLDTSGGHMRHAGQHWRIHKPLTYVTKKIRTAKTNIDSTASHTYKRRMTQVNAFKYWLLVSVCHWV